MKLPRRQFLHLAASAAALPAVSRFAWAQAYPARPVRIIVGFPAGGPTDIVARVMAQWLSERLGRQFVVENRAGAASNIGTEAALRAPPDGYTLLQVTSSNAVNATFYENLSFDFINDIATVGAIIRVPFVMEVNPSVPARTVPVFIAYAKANPGRINMASGGTGTSIHIAGELFKMMAGVNLVHVPYRGSAPALTDMIGGQVHVMFDVLTSSIGHIRSGALRALAVTTATRSQVLPDLPTVGAAIDPTTEKIKLGENATGRDQKHPLESFGLKLERCRASQRHRDELGDSEVAEPMSLRLLNMWSANLLPDDARTSFVRSICLELPSNLDHTCGYGERAVLHGVRPKFMQGQTDLLGRLRIQFQFGPFDKNRVVIQIVERG